MDGGAALRASAISSWRFAMRYCSTGAISGYGVLRAWDGARSLQLKAARKAAARMPAAVRRSIMVRTGAIPVPCQGKRQVIRRQALARCAALVDEHFLGAALRILLSAAQTVARASSGSALR